MNNISKMFNIPLRMCGLELLGLCESDSIGIAFFDPQYRGSLDKLKIGNEGLGRNIKRGELSQMDDAMVRDFMVEIERVLRPSGHLFLWIDKFHLCEGIDDWIEGTELNKVDLIVWDKERMGMGYRSRKSSEFLFVLQKSPCRAKGIWNDNSIPDVWRERVLNRRHIHQKPFGLLRRLIGACSVSGDVVLDPAAGSFAVLEACRELRVDFWGCDIQSDFLV